MAEKRQGVGVRACMRAWPRIFCATLEDLTVCPFDILSGKVELKSVFAWQHISHVSLPTSRDEMCTCTRMPATSTPACALHFLNTSVLDANSFTSAATHEVLLHLQRRL